MVDMFDLKNQILLLEGLLEEKDVNVKLEDSEIFKATVEALESVSQVNYEFPAFHKKYLSTDLLIERNQAFLVNFYRSKQRKSVNTLIHFILEGNPSKETINKQIETANKLANTFGDAFLAESMKKIESSAFHSKEDLLEEAAKMRRNVLFSLFFKEKSIVGFAKAFLLEKIGDKLFEFNPEFASFSGEEEQTVNTLKTVSYLKHLINEEKYLKAYEMTGKLGKFSKESENLSAKLKENATSQFTFDVVNEYLI